MYLGTSFISPTTSTPAPQTQTVYVTQYVPRYVSQPAAPTGVNQATVLDTAPVPTNATGSNNQSGGKFQFSTQSPDQTIEIPMPFVSPQDSSATADSAQGLDWKTLAIIAAAVALAVLLLKRKH